MRQQSMVGLLLKGRRLWQKASLLSHEVLNSQLCMCCSFHSTHQGMQHGVVQSSNIRAHLASPSDYKGPVIQNGGLLCSCTHQLRPMKTLPGDVLIIKKTLGSCNGIQNSNKNTTPDCFIGSHHGDFGCYPKPFNTIATSDSNALGKTLSNLVFGATSSLDYSSSFINSLPQSRRMCSGLWSWRRRDPLWIGRRSLSSAGSYETLSNLGSELLQDSASSMQASDVAEAETNALSCGSDENFDFRNFPALTSSFYQDYERPSEMQTKKRVTWQTRRKLFNTDIELTVESIPQAKGRTYDFDLGDISSKPPPLEAGARPQGGFDIDISLDEREAAPSEMPLSCLASLQKMPSCKVSWDTPEADNWSEISTDSQRDKDSASRPEQEFCWDPYDFDANVKLPHKLEFEDSSSLNVAAH